MQAALTIKNLTHRFTENGITACRGITIEIKKGEILAFLGENGAGKSTLMFLLSGALTPTSGTISTPSGSTSKDRRDYIGMIHQKPILAGNLTVLENIILEGQGVFFHPQSLAREISAVQKQYDLSLDLGLKAMDLTAPQIQRAELIRALWKKKQMIILDEPTASLSDSQSERLFLLMQQLKKEGKTIIFITHKIHEVLKTADRIAVLRKGELLGLRERENFNGTEISSLMIGEADYQQERIKSDPPGDKPLTGPVLELKNVDVQELGTRRLKEISFNLYPGEILGISGIRENGLTHLEDLLTGIIQPSGGKIIVKGKNNPPLTPFKLRRWGVSYIPADRLSRGAAPNSTVAENLSVLKRELSGGFKSYRKRILVWAGEYIRKHSIAGKPEQKVKTLSGGNIQKMIVARELGNTPRLLLVSEPSWGLDFKSREILHRQLLEARQKGTAVLLLTTDLDEMLFLSDRAFVLTEGSLIEISRNEKEWNRTYVGEKMTGADRV